MPFQAARGRQGDRLQGHSLSLSAYPQRLNSVEIMEKLIAPLQKAHYEAERDYSSALAKDGMTRVNFIIEGV